jgi:pimeloyl-ACP methyl ester carboxylesterase
VIVVQGLLGVWLATSLLERGPASVGAAGVAMLLLVMIGVVAALQLAFTAAAMLLSASAGAGAGTAAGGATGGDWAGVRAWLSESGVFASMQWLMALEPWLTRRWDAPATGSRPVLLVHGIFCNRGIWWRLRRRLVASGYGPVVAVNLPRPAGAIDAQVGSLEQALERLQSLAPGAPVLVVAHSMGGLVVRGLLARRPTAPIGRLVTVGTPHRGSALARLCPSRGCRDLRPGSAWLLAHEPTAGSSPVPATAIYSLDDDLIGPRTSAHWPAARNVAVRGVGHFGLIAAGHSIATLLDEIEAAA